MGGTRSGFIVRSAVWRRVVYILAPILPLAHPQVSTYDDGKLAGRQKKLLLAQVNRAGPERPEPRSFPLSRCSCLSPERRRVPFWWMTGRWWLWGASWFWSPRRVGRMLPPPPRLSRLKARCIMTLVVG